MHQIACIYIVVPQKEWNNTYLETAYTLEGVNITELTRIIICKFF